MGPERALCAEQATVRSDAQHGSRVRQGLAPCANPVVPPPPTVYQVNTASWLAVSADSLNTPVVESVLTCYRGLVGVVGCNVISCHAVHHRHNALAQGVELQRKTCAQECMCHLSCLPCPVGQPHAMHTDGACFLVT